MASRLQGCCQPNCWSYNLILGERHDITIESNEGLVGRDNNWQGRMRNSRDKSRHFPKGSE